jgi:signal transduction histidine kinase/DNA-binding response OmpR family regulator
MGSLDTLYGLRASGEEFPVEATVSRVDVGGQKLLTVILRDISQRRQSEETARLYAQAKELDRLKTEFFANISHELRTPLALILGPARKILAAARLPEGQRHDLELIERNALLLLRHVNDLLDLAKVDAGRMTAGYAALDLAQLVRRVAANFESMARDCGVTLQVEAPSAVPAELDPDKMERVLLNLISNALKFTPSGGVVRVEARQSSSWAVVEVEDTGPGIPEVLRESIFERFRQLEDGGGRRFGGTGLGLSIVKQFVDLHGGTVTVEEGRGGRGALFRVELPSEAPDGSAVHRGPLPSNEEMAQTMPGTGTQAAAVGSPELPDDAPLVLLVEDNPDMNLFLANTLAATCRVYRAFDGEEGVEKALAVRPDLILCDVMMPRMTGDALVREIRRRPDFDDVPIVLLTARADDELRVQLLQDGAQDYLHKPFDTRTVVAKVERLLADRRRHREAQDALHRRSGRLLQAQDRERQHVARALNENIAQCLSALGIYLQMAQSPAPSADAACLEQGMAVLKQCVADVQDLSQALHPLVLDNLGLRAAIEWHVHGFATGSGIAVTLDAPEPFGRLSAEYELALFRVLQDALARVRQAGCRQAGVRVFRDAVGVELEVAAGPEAFRTGDEEDMAMAAIEERVRKLGGRLDLLSEPGKTTIRASLPCAAGGEPSHTPNV